jgi:hypothetical protein
MLDQGMSHEVVAKKLGISLVSLPVYISKAKKPEKYETYTRDKERIYRHRGPVGEPPESGVGSSDWWTARGF